MTDEQFRQFLAVQTAELAVLSGILGNLQVIAAEKGKVCAYNWGEVQSLIKNATAVLSK